MHQLRDGRRGFHASTLSGIPSHTRGRKEGGTERFGCAGALVSVDIEPRMIEHLKNENVQFFGDFSSSLNQPLLTNSTKVLHSWLAPSCLEMDRQ